MTTLSLLLRAARRLRGFTQADVAARIGVTTAMVGHYETGYAVPTPEMARKLSRVLTRGKKRGVA